MARIIAIAEGPLPVPEALYDPVMLVLALVLDLAFRELPNRLHPTAWIGQTVSWAEKLSPSGPRASLAAGVIIVVIVAGGWMAAAVFAVQGLREIHYWAYILVGAVLLNTTFAVKMLGQAAFRVRNLLAVNDLDQVRANMASLVSRDPSNLTPDQAAAATVESVSENMSDGFIGPWLAFALFGLPGAVAYRAINTLDSMIGYHGRYEYLGKAAARLDDLINVVPSRLTGLLLVAAGLFLPGQNPKQAWRIMWRDHSRTESPNAGWPMSAMAGALGVQLEKLTSSGESLYRLGSQDHPLEHQDITRSIHSMYLVAGLGIVLVLVLTYIRASFLW